MGVRAPVAGAPLSVAGEARRALAARLRSKCERGHLVVWNDLPGSYADIVDAVAPDGWKVARYEGSWWALRRSIEPSMAAPEPPKLIVYLAGPAPEADPLQEVRLAGERFDLPLSKLIRDALAGELSGARIVELAARCVTLTELEAALEGSASIDPILVKQLGARDVEAAFVAVLECNIEALSEEGRSAIAALGHEYLGVELDPQADVPQLSADLARHLVVATIASDAGDEVAQGLSTSWKPLSRAQQSSVQTLVDRMFRPDSIDRWGDLSDQAAWELDLDPMEWDDRLVLCDVSRIFDDRAFSEAARLLETDVDGALTLVAGRTENSRWLRWRSEWSNRMLADLEAVRSIARLRHAIEMYPCAAAPSLGAVQDWYTAGAWTVDRAQRRMEASRIGLRRPDLDAAFTAVRDAYLAWLDQVLEVSRSAAETAVESTLQRQSDIYPSQVVGDGRTAFVIVDALRYELGERLAEMLAGTVGSATVSAAIAAVPTITAVGMANLVPDAGVGGLAVGIESEKLIVRAAGRPIRTVEDRTTSYERAAGRVADHRLDDLLSLGADALASRIDGADLVIVRSQEIDAVGENGLASVRWSQIDAALEMLAILVGRLLSGSIDRVVVTADHGFIALGRPLDPSRVRLAPAGPGASTHGRAWVGRPSSVPDGCSSLALGDFGIDSSDQLVVTGGMSVFGSSGSAFFHGGISPQEMVIPVVTIEAAAEERRVEPAAVEVAVPGGKVSAEAFSAAISLGSSLFSKEMAVRTTVTDEAGVQVARLMPSAGVDPESGLVQLEPGSDAIVTYLVTENVDRGRTVQVAVVDATSGRLLASTNVTVTKDLRPQEEW